MSAEIWFYHLQRQPIERVLPKLLEKSLDNRWRATVQARSEERLVALDQLLWTYSDASFLAHGRACDGDADMQPVFLTTEHDNPNGSALRLFIEGADIVDHIRDHDGDAYKRMIVLFNGHDNEELTIARRQWQELKALAQSLTYWQQNDDDRWEKKA